MNCKSILNTLCLALFAITISFSQSANEIENQEALPSGQGSLTFYKQSFNNGGAISSYLNNSGTSSGSTVYSYSSLNEYNIGGTNENTAVYGITTGNGSTGYGVMGGYGTNIVAPDRWAALGTSTHAMRIVDGNEGAGKILMSTANGSAGWNDPGNMVFSPYLNVEHGAGFGSGGIKMTNTNSNHIWDIYVDANIGAGDLFFLFGGGSPATAKIDYASGNWVPLSDERRKKEIQPKDAVLDKVMDLNPVSYQFNHQKAEDNRHIEGFLAQEVQEVFPDMVHHQEETDTYMFSITELIPVLTKAIQEQQETINTLTERIEELEKN